MTFSNSKINNIEQIIYSEDIEKIILSLDQILEEKSTIKYVDEYYMHLCYLESIARYKISKSEFSTINDAFSHLYESLACAKQIQLYYKLNKDMKSLKNLAALQQEAIILYEVSILKDDISLLEKSFELLDCIRKNLQKDSKLYHQTLMNETNFRLELASKKINVKENCLRVMKLCESSRKNFPINSNEYNATFLNQSNALALLLKHEDYGLGIEFYEIMKRLISKYDENELLRIYIDLELIELGYGKFKELENILNLTDEMLDKLSPNLRKYHEYIIIKANTLLKKAHLCNNELKKIEYLNLCVFHLDNYLQKNIKDKFYMTKAMYKKAYAKLKLSKLNINKRNNLNESLVLLNEAKEFYEKTPYQNNRLLYPQVLLYISKTEKELKTLENSLTEYNNSLEKSFLEAMKYFEDLNDKMNIIDCYHELGHLFFEIQNYEKSYYYLNKGISLAEVMRSSMHNLNIKKEFFEKISRLYELIIKTSVNLKRDEETLKFIEMSKHRIFLDRISENQRFNVIDPNSSPLVHELDNINLKINQILNRLKNCDEHEYRISSDYRKLIKLKEKYEYLLNELQSRFPDIYNYLYNYVFDFKKIDLKGKTMIEYYYTKGMMLICLVKNDDITVKQVDFDHNELLETIDKYKRNLKISEYEEDYESALNKIKKTMEKLYDILIKPIEDEISDELLIIPYGQLHNIPFYCLKNDDEFLIDTCTITMAQSGSSIKYIENNSSKANMKSLVIAVEDNESIHAIKEAEYVSKRLNTIPLINEEATKENVLDSVEAKSTIHYVGHGCFDSKNPLESHLKLYDDNLFLRDLEEKNINCELIVLSACETGIASADNNDNTMSFITSLHVDGTKYIIASMWRVFGDSSMEVFKHFYNSPGDYPKMLRLAQLELKNKNKDLLHWGGFQIYGI